jgi:organic radical activating enzyme
MRIRYSEIFHSIQGEGKWVGTPSVFLRTFGCNLTCEGFGQPRDNHIPEEEMPHMLMDISNVKSVEDLPVVDIGCDSSASWSAKYKHLSPFATTAELAYKISEFAPWSKDNHLVITGGEPLLGWQKAYIEMFDHPELKDLTHLTFETNGSKKVINEFTEYLNFLHDDRIMYDKKPMDITWMCSPKLSITGEDQSIAIDADALLSMNKVRNSNINLKFVIRDKEDIIEVEQALAKYADAGVIIEDVYLMPEGATLEGQELTERNVADLCMEHGYKFSPRLHITLFGNSWGT